MTTTTTRDRDSLTASARQTAAAAAAPHRRPTIDEYRREEADRAIARIEECYRRGLVIPRLW